MTEGGRQEEEEEEGGRQKYLADRILNLNIQLLLMFVLIIKKMLTALCCMTRRAVTLALTSCE